MADGVDWPAEYIPDEAETYMRAHRTHFRGKNLQPGVFRAHGGGMSVDWDKYSTPEETRQRASNPLDNAVIRLPVVGIRDISTLEVEHTPVCVLAHPNRAHSDVLGIPDGGEDLTEIRASLLDIARVVLSL
jgi:hypothetical protein